MKEKVKNLALKLHPKRVATLFDTFLKDESIGGKLILVAALLSLIVVNSPLRDEFNHFWHLPLSIGLGSWSLSLDLRHWVNEGLMAFFFLVVGLEIKRELVKGELKNKKTAILPIGAAIGGMIIPALIYLIFNINSGAIQGWGIPIATDIAFAVAVLSLLSNRVPVSLKIFLLTLAIADDIGAIFVIALFYAEIINYWYLGASFLVATLTFLFRKQLTYRLFIVCMLGILLWITTHLSGIHASIVGAVLGFLAPVAKSSKMAVSEKVEKALLPITTFFILPVFAFANAGFTLSASALTTNQSILWGVIFGLVLGKVIGITLASWLLVKLRVAQLPVGVVWKHIIGIGFIAGIGFTVSIFITELAFSDNDSFVNTAKIGIFIASGASALLGYIILRSIPFSRDNQ
ncbi:Na+/H+ antiporter NhaA [Candidatus Saccharibacteria bacterium]|nr:Na+/H+ antiporter NhaA [Candidatus Saccharibacteria bacterium]